MVGKITYPHATQTILTCLKIESKRFRQVSFCLVILQQILKVPVNQS